MNNIVVEFQAGGGRADKDVNKWKTRKVTKATVLVLGVVAVVSFAAIFGGHSGVGSKKLAVVRGERSEGTRLYPLGVAHLEESGLGEARADSASLSLLFTFDDIPNPKTAKDCVAGRTVTWNHGVTLSGNGEAVQQGNNIVAPVSNTGSIVFTKAKSYAVFLEYSIRDVSSNYWFFLFGKMGSAAFPRDMTLWTNPARKELTFAITHNGYQCRGFMTSAYDANKKYNVAFVYDAATELPQFYVNGVAAQQTCGKVTVESVTTNLIYLGGDPSGVHAQSFPGTFYRVMLFDDKIDLAMIQDISADNAAWKAKLQAQAPQCAQKGPPSMTFTPDTESVPLSPTAVDVPNGRLFTASEPITFDKLKTAISEFGCGKIRGSFKIIRDMRSMGYGQNCVVTASSITMTLSKSEPNGNMWRGAWGLTFTVGADSSVTSCTCLDGRPNHQPFAAACVLKGQAGAGTVIQLSVERQNWYASTRPIEQMNTNYARLTFGYGSSVGGLQLCPRFEITDASGSKVQFSKTTCWFSNADFLSIIGQNVAKNIYVGVYVHTPTSWGHMMAFYACHVKNINGGVASSLQVLAGGTFPNGYGLDGTTCDKTKVQILV